MFSSKDIYLTPPSKGGYTISRSLRFRSSASAYLNRTPSVAGNLQKFTFSAWVKRGIIDGANAYTIFAAGTNGSSALDSIEWNTTTNGLRVFSYNGSYVYQYVTNAVYRDPAAWYHVVVAIDTTQATAGNRVLIYVNGVQITSFSTSTAPTQNANTAYFNTTNAHYICKYINQSVYTDQYMTEINFIDGQQLTPTSFGAYNATTGVWQPVKYTGTYGTNGFYLPFSNNTSTTTLGADSSGNGNNWTCNNISLTAGVTYDSMTDVPTLTSATASNYCVMNPVAPSTSGAPTVSNGNLKVQTGTTGNLTWATMAIPTSGKWYWEITVTVNIAEVGIVPYQLSTAFIDATSVGLGYFSNNGNKILNGTRSAYGATYATGDVLGFAVDVDGGTVTIYKNNTSQGAITVATAGWFPACSDSGSGGNAYEFNFGQQGFKYTPPTGFVALNTYNLPTPTILQGNKYMDATLWSGGQSSPFSVTNAGSFKPDLVWAKERSSAASNRLYDSVRGTGVALLSNSTAAEQTETNTGVSAFQTAGFQITNSNGVAPYLNDTSQTYVGWQWQAGQGSTSSNTSGTITSTVSVNTTAGFSIATYTGNGVTSATVGHGLGVTPAMVIVKSRNATSDWFIWQNSLPSGYQLRFTTAAQEQVSSATTAGGLGTPNSTTFGFISGTTNTNNVNNSGTTYVAYCFAAIAGYSAFGSYTGNGSTNGPFIYLGFRPRYIMVKRTDSTANWIVEDTSRSTYNVTAAALYPNLSNAEDTSYSWDILSNGFKIRDNSVGDNASGGTYIYMAFAENPFKNSLAR